ncbi:MAG: hypothetical protein H0W64_04395 [Gammaproteobacteria bacterium]|nr:hypothetical protein [Gammaproteobacteria bacterium]
MKMYKLICLSSLLAFGVAHAASVPCNGFEIKIKNNSSDDLIINKIALQGAEIQPGTIQKLNAHVEQVFTVNKSQDDKTMNGSFEFHSLTVPTKKVSIKYDLKNKNLACHHYDLERAGDYSIDKTRLPGHVTYTID